MITKTTCTVLRSRMVIGVNTILNEREINFIKFNIKEYDINPAFGYF
jgi:hypothetical protein